MLCLCRYSHCVPGLVRICVKTHPHEFRADSFLLAVCSTWWNIYRKAGMLCDKVQLCRAVCLQVRYPDKQVQLILPRLADFRQLEDLKYRLYTTVLLSHGVWSGETKKHHFSALFTFVFFFIYIMDALSFYWKVPHIAM